MPEAPTFLLVGGDSSLEVRLGAGGGHRHRTVAGAGARVLRPLLPRLVRDLAADLGGVSVVGDHPLYLASLRRAPLTVLSAAGTTFRKEIEIPRVHEASTLHLRDDFLVGDQKKVFTDQIFNFFRPWIPELLPF